MEQEQLFQNKLQFEIWLDDILHTDNRHSRYEENQIRVGDVVVPTGNIMNREALKRLLLEYFTPYLNFVTYSTFSTFESSETVRGNLSHYMANTLQEDLSLATGMTVVTFIDCSEDVVTHATLSVQETVYESLQLDHLYKFLVLHYLLEKQEPITYLVSSNHVTLQNEETEEQRDIVCKDTNAYVRLYQEWHLMQAKLAKKVRPLEAQKG